MVEHLTFNQRVVGSNPAAPTRVSLGFRRGPKIRKISEYTFGSHRQKHLESVEAFSKAAGIPFMGFHYTAVAERPKTSLNEKRARLQFEVLEEEHIWLSDEEANKRMQGGKQNEH